MRQRPIFTIYRRREPSKKGKKRDVVCSKSPGLRPPGIPFDLTAHSMVYIVR